MESSLKEISYGVASIHQNASINSIDGIPSNQIADSDFDRNLAWLRDDYKVHKTVVLNIRKWDLCGQFIKEYDM